MAAHATLGASNSDRWMTCPGSVKLSEGIPNVGSKYAAEGTAAHALGEMALRRGKPAAFWIGEEVEGFLVTEEMAEAVQIYVDYVRERADGCSLQLEQRFSLEKLKPPVPMFGTSDCTIIDDLAGVLHVVDYKHGQGVAVDAFDNPQLKYYALGAWLAMSEPIRGTIDRIRMTIVQPRAAHDDGPIRTAEMSVSDLIDFGEALIVAAHETQKPDAPLFAGEHCRWCLAKAKCPQQARQAQELAAIEFSAPVALPPAPSTLTPEQIAQVLSKAELVEDWISAVRQHAESEIAAGRDVPGFKLVAKRGTRKWVSERDVREWADEVGIDATDLFDSKLKSPAQIEKLIGKNNVPSHLCIIQSSGHTLAPSSDKRPALLLGAADEFSNVNAND